MPALWREVLRFQPDAVRPSIGVRNAAGVAIPLALGAALRAGPTALLIATGALNVAFSDSDVPYAIRVRRMLAASLVVGVGVIAGALCAGHAPLVVLAAAAWAFAAGLLIALDQTAADLATISLVTLIVFAALPMSPEKALAAGALACAGGLAQTAISILAWPLRRYAIERRALAGLFHGLADVAGQPAVPTAPPALSTLTTGAQDSLAALDRDYSVEAERYRALLSQAERIRLRLLALHRIRVRLDRAGADPDTLRALCRFLEISAALLHHIADELTDGITRDDHTLRSEARALADRLRPDPSPIGPEGIKLIDAIAGQVRAAADLDSRAVPRPRPQPAPTLNSDDDARRPRRLRLQSAWSTLRANLSLQSAACRHAIRLAAAVAIAETAGHAFGLARAYWAPMTVAIVLKPDFTATFTRGVLRLSGTFVGLALATALFHAGALAPGSEIALIALLVFAARAFGSANYGIAATAITALVVLLIALNGVSPAAVIAARGLNTVIGGAVSLLVYAVWPTWERTQIADIFARLLDAYAAYFHALHLAYENPRHRRPATLDAVRLAGRRARSNAEASMLRLAAEPGTGPALLRRWSGMLANSHRLANALMALEVGLAADPTRAPRPEFLAFAAHVETFFAALSAALRGAPLDPAALPDLREDHNRLIHSGDPARYNLVNTETDRIVNTLNTLAEL